MPFFMSITFTRNLFLLYHISCLFFSPLSTCYYKFTLCHVSIEFYVPSTKNIVISFLLITKYK